MKKTLLTIIGLIIIFSIYTLEYSPNQLIIKTKRLQSLSDKSLSKMEFRQYFDIKSLTSIKSLSHKAKDTFFVLNFDKKVNITQIKSALNSNPDLEYVQYNYLNNFYIQPNDSLYANQVLAVEAINLPEAWNYSTGSPQVLVGIVDSGILFDHPDLQNNVFINQHEIAGNGIDDDENGYIDDIHGWDFADAPSLSDIGIGDYTERDNDPTDENSHGTHVAGIIAADSNNNRGIAGTAWNIKILPIRAGFRTTQGQGYLEDDDAAAAIIYATDMGCQVLNMSWGDRNYSPIIEDACNYAASKGVILVASAGNTPEPIVSYPARLGSVIAVGAVGESEQLAGFSSYGPDLDIMAPGQNIMSSYSMTNLYSLQSGTSMSSPFVAGAVALLLSQESTLTLNDVRARLHASAKDLGVAGFDNLYGAGLLNVKQLLINKDFFTINLTYPLDRQFVSDDFELIGSVNSPDFFRYSIMYSDKDNPQENNWKDIYTHLPTPSYYYTSKDREVIGTFHFIPLFADSEYRIRIRIETKKGKTHDFIQRILVDREAPHVIDNSLFVQKRWMDNKVQNYVMLAVSEKVQIDIQARVNENIQNLYSTVPDSIFSFILPENLGIGNLDIKLKIVDLAGHSVVSDWYQNVIAISHDEINNQDYIAQEIGTAMLYARNTYDFDANLKEEILAMEIDNNANGLVKALEFQNNSFITKHVFDEKFNPLFIANKNTADVDLYALKLDKLEVYSAIGDLQYPDLALWNLSEVNGAISCDFDGDTHDDLVVVRNLADQTVIELYQKNNYEYTKFNTIYNSSPTTVRRMFVPKICAGNLDNDNKLDLLTADIDGDVMIFEWDNQTQASKLVWSRRLPILNAYYLSIADYDGDGNKEFCVGGYVKETDPNKSFWHFEWFKALDNNAYTQIGEINFANVITGQSSVSEADIDGDGKAELIASITPNVYVIKYENNNIRPIWYAQADKTFQILALNQSAEAPGGFFINRTEEDNSRAYFVKKNTPFTGPQTPQYLRLEVLDENSVKLTWDSNNAESYNVYRKISEDGVVELINNTNTNEYTDTGLEIDKDYYYSVTAKDSNYNPAESQFSAWIKIHTAFPAELESAKMISTQTLIIGFSQKLSSASANRGNFKIINNQQVINPSSVSLIQSDKSLLLFFNTPLTLNSDFALEYTNLYAYNNIAIPDSSVNVLWQMDSVSPSIKSVKLIDDIKLKINFTELIKASVIDDLTNFSIESPIPELHINVLSAELADSTITLNLNQKLQNSLKAYWIKCQNIYDLADNKIQNNQNRYCLLLTEISDLSFMEVYPNPLKSKEVNEVTFANIPDTQVGEVKIYNLSGDLVFEQRVSHKSEFTWSAVNNQGKRVSSGIYIYLLKMGKDLKKGKIVVIN